MEIFGIEFFALQFSNISLVFPILSFFTQTYTQRNTFIISYFLTYVSKSKNFCNVKISTFFNIFNSKGRSTHFTSKKVKNYFDPYLLELILVYKKQICKELSSSQTFSQVFFFFLSIKLFLWLRYLWCTPIHQAFTVSGSLLMSPLLSPMYDILMWQLIHVHESDS